MEIAGLVYWGKVTLIKSVLESLPTYYFSIYKAPVTVINELEALIKKFLWGGNLDVKKIHWVAWDKVTCTKKNGGLGLKRLNISNSVLLLKWVWRYRVEAGALWRKIIDSIHYKKRKWGVMPLNNCLTGTWKNLVRHGNITKVEGRSMNDLMKGAQKDQTFELELNNNIQSQMIHGQNSERILWLGDFSVCSKGLKHYPAFIRDETTVTVHSFALIKGEDENEHIGYVEDLYEDYIGHKMVKVRWFNCSEEPHEVMITPDVEVVSAECIPGLATVLTPKHYDQSLAVVSEDFSDGVYMCSRQIRNNRVTSFPLSKLRGYANQTIFSILNPPVIPQSSPPVIPSPALSDVGEEIEVLHDDSGLRGSWFRCRILKAKGKRLKVVYVDLEEAEGHGNTEASLLYCYYYYIGVNMQTLSCFDLI
ncbi:uncharacterized protein LOC143635460 [Bidens hawaiensis]|uniref:uncharacterized protein LOC143635460 n=1 Tax=Bidens hawaiensis TaxID=980011 RepID=UPI00404AD3A2